MNKKIEELAKESCLHGYMVHLYTVYAPDGYRVPLENRMISVEKFAELIVKECAEQIIAKGTDWVDFAPSQTGVRPEYRDMAQQIKQHFGIE
jgi:hypothetical protein